MLKGLNFRRIVCICVAIIELLGIVCSLVYISSNGQDYTEEYKVYKEVKSITELNKVREKLQDLRLEYTVTSTKLLLNDYDHVSFSVLSDGTCTINSDKFMNNFEKMDNEDLSVAVIHGIKENTKVIEKITIKDNTNVYTKISHRYYISDNNFFIVTIMCCVFFSISICYLLYDVLSEKKKKQILLNPKY